MQVKIVRNQICCVMNLRKQLFELKNGKATGTDGILKALGCMEKRVVLEEKRGQVSHFICCLLFTMRKSTTNVRYVLEQGKDSQHDKIWR